jgi:hypothetical protein
MKPKFLAFILLFAMVVSVYTVSKASDPTPPPDQALQELHEHMRAGEPAPVLAEVSAALAPAAVDDFSWVYPWSKVVFQSYRDGNWELYLADQNMTNPLRLTVDPANNPKVDTDPRLNRGTNRVVFASNRDGDYEIYSMNIDGTDVKQLTINKATTANTAVDASPAWSPDGSRIAFESNRDGNWEVYVMNADGSNQVRLTNDPAYDETPSWTPDGSQVIWAHRITTSPYGDIIAANPDGSTPQVLKSSIPFPLNPFISPDGVGLAYNFDYDADGWYEIGCWRLLEDDLRGGNLVCQNGPSVSDSGANVDDILGGWQPDSFGLVFGRLSYIYLNSKYYLTSAGIYHTTHIFESSTEPLISTGFDLEPDWTTSDVLPPISFVSAFPELTKFGSGGYTKIPITWVDTDHLGFRHFQVQYRQGSTGPWQPLCTQSDNDSNGCSVNNLIFGTVVNYFRSRAMDYSGNMEPWPANPDYDTWTKFYSWSLNGLVLDNRAFPIRGATISADQPLVTFPKSNLAGQFTALVQPLSDVTINVLHPGFGQLPTTTVSQNIDTSRTKKIWLLPPKDNLILNGNFEDPTSTAWVYSGLEAQFPYSNENVHSGTSSAVLKYPFPWIPSPTLNASLPTNAAIVSSSFAIDSQQNVAAFWSTSSKIFYTERPAGGQWGSVNQITTANQAKVASAFTSDETLTLIWIENSSTTDPTQYAVYALQKPKSQAWGAAKKISPDFIISSTSTDNSKIPCLAADHEGGLHVVYGDDAGVWYLRYSATADWAQGQLVASNGKDGQLKVDLNDGVHFLWRENYTPYYAKRSDTGFIGKEAIPGISSEAVFTVDSQGQVHVASITAGGYNIYGIIYSIRSTDGTWSSGPAKYFNYTATSSSPRNLLALEFGPQNNLYLAWRSSINYLHVVILYSKEHISLGYDILNSLNDNTADDQGFSFDFDHDQAMYGLWAGKQTSTNYQFFFANLTAPGPSDASISQTVTIPAEMQNPTLSFFLRMSYSEYSGGVFDFRVNGTSVGVNLAATVDGYYYHGWVDMSPWAGQTIEVKFNVRGTYEFMDPYAPRFWIDEVSLGTWQPARPLDNITFVPIMMKQ